MLKRATITLCSRAHGRAAAQKWLALGSCYSRCRWRPVCLQTGHQYADDNKSSKTILHVRLFWHKSLADFQAKIERLGPTEPGSAHGQTQIRKKKRKLGPTDRQSGSVQTMTPPRHADKDCLTTEENVTISSSRITRQGRCRCGAAESSLVSRNHQPTKKAESSKNHWRHENSCMLKSLSKRDR